MAGPLGGPSNLPVGQYLYPVSLTNGELVGAGNVMSLSGGQVLALPRGRFYVFLDGYALLQYYDPTSTTWRTFASSRPSPTLVDSDGFNIRVANMTGCAIAAIVTTAGSAYVQGSTTATPSAGNSQWQPVIGGLLNRTISVSAAGAGYGIAPLVFIPPPPAPGVQASAVAVISSGTVSSITVVNQGAGYTTAPSVTILPCPLDPNYLSGSITSNATAVATLTGAGTLAAMLCTNPGAPFTTVPSLTIAGAGTSAAATIVPMWTATATSVTSGGAGYSTTGYVTSVGGLPSATPAYTNPTIELTGYIPRPAVVPITTISGGTIATLGTIIDGGLFAGTPTVIAPGGSTSATIAFTLGSTTATVLIQKAD